jgi:hypothetical protein
MTSRVRLPFFMTSQSSRNSDSNVMDSVSHESFHQRFTYEEDTPRSKSVQHSVMAPTPSLEDDCYIINFP